MVDVPEVRRSSLTPLRLLIGALVLGGGVTVLGLLFGGGSANAAEPPAPDPLGSVVSSLTTGVGETAHAVTSAVAPALPAPVRSTVAQVVQPVTQVVDHVAEATPVAAVVTPVAATVDKVVAATPVSQLPIVGAVLGATPVESLTAPVAAVADGTVSNVSAALDTAVKPLAPATSQPPVGGTPTVEPGAPGQVSTESPAALVTTAVAPDAGVWAASGFALFPPAIAAGAAGSARSSAPAPGGAPPGGSDPPSPGVPSGSLGASSSAGSSGGAASAPAVSGDALATPSTIPGGRAALPSGDDLPAAPLFDHDISPD